MKAQKNDKILTKIVKTHSELSKLCDSRGSLAKEMGSDFSSQFEDLGNALSDVDESISEISNGYEMMLDEAKKLDPVGKADADIDNDGDVDDSDKFLKKRRAAIGKAMKEALEKKLQDK